MIKTIIIEDEAPARARLSTLITAHPELELTNQCANGNQAIQQINSLKPDLIFLDIHLPDISGLDILKVLDHQPMVIFTTAYDKYAINAFEHNAVDFLLKPFSKDRFVRAVQKVASQISGSENINAQIQSILTKWQQPDLYLSRIPAKLGERIFILKSAEIIYIQSKDKVVFAHQQNDYFIINYTLDELQNRLDPEQFFRIHRATIVNLNNVHTIEPLFGGAYLMKMNDKHKTELNVSRNAGKMIRDKLGW